MSFLKFSILLVILAALNIIPYFSTRNYLHQFCIDRLSSTDSESELYKALICGVKLTHNSDWYQISKSLGLLHLFVISGAHLVFITGHIKKILKILGLSKRLLPYILFLFTWMNHLQPPILRAWISSLVNIVTKKYHLNWPPIYNLLVTGAFTLLSFPRFHNSLSFYFSWTAALIVSQYRHLPPLERQIRIYLFLLPLLLPLYTPHPITILCNLLIAPIIMGLFLPLSFLVFTFPFLSQFLTPFWSYSKHYLIQITLIIPNSGESSYETISPELYLVFLQIFFIISYKANNSLEKELKQ